MPPSRRIAARTFPPGQYSLQVLAQPRGLAARAEEDTVSEAATRAQIDERRNEVRRLSNLLTGDREPAYGEGREAI
ncbi:hypothetical protein GGC64_002961 [Mycobacterium sp. OAS707]|uniref:hypothetical protein n=1 Tax=Mycobacterium sp. OAS707 TaxID=2663822 RepID=UPI00178BB8F5|nr:hypothetical protein [Mycobacterium sp. OAS707]MBE1548937.1 hypothetical protein [Mycobacterium sp. OAS707]